MDGLYRGIETSLLALGLALMLGVTVLPRMAAAPYPLLAAVETTLPMITVTAGEAD